MGIRLVKVSTDLCQVAVACNTTASRQLQVIRYGPSDFVSYIYLAHIMLEALPLQVVGDVEEELVRARALDILVPENEQLLQLGAHLLVLLHVRFLPMKPGNPDFTPNLRAS